MSASGFENKWRAWSFIMFRTLFFLRLECGQECVVALQALKGRKTYQPIMLKEEGGDKRDMQGETDWNRDLKKCRSGGKNYLETNSALLLRVNQGIVKSLPCGWSSDGRLASFYWLTPSLSLTLSLSVCFRFSLQLLWCFVLQPCQHLHNCLPVIGLLV